MSLSLTTDAVCANVQAAVDKMLAELNMLRGFKKDRRRLRTVLEPIKQLVDDARQRRIDTPEESSLRRSLYNLADAVYGADDIVDRIRYENISYKDLLRMVVGARSAGGVKLKWIVRDLKSRVHEATTTHRLIIRKRGGDISLSYADPFLTPEVWYHKLPSASLKKCFSYCSVFPVDSILDREELVQLWMAQGFLLEKGMDNMESTGNLYFNILLRIGFFQELREDKVGGHVVSCKMSDAAHVLASHVSASETPNIEDHDNDDHLNIPEYVYTTSSSGSFSGRARALFSKSNLTDDMLPHLHRLRSLVLREAEIKEFPTSIDDLIHLRHLDLSHNPIQRLPHSVCKLCHLETLRIFTSTLEELPEMLHELVNLRHLYFDGLRIETPPHIGRLTCLRTLSSFSLRDEEGCRIDELGYLKKLEGKLTIRNLELVKDKQEAKKADLFGKTKISELKLIWSKSREWDTNDQDVLDGLHPQQNLESLEIEGFNGKNFPSWTMKMGDLVQIKIAHCNSCEKLPVLSHLQSLKYLEFDGLTSVRSIDTSFYGSTRQVYFPSLERLVVNKMSNLVDWKEPKITIMTTTTTVVKVFPRLKHLEVTECPKLTDIPPSFSSLPAPALKYLKFDALTSIKYIDTSPFFQSLERLVLKRMSNLVTWECKMTCHELRYLELSSCPQLMHVPTDFPCLTNLHLRSLKTTDSLLAEICNGHLTSLTNLQIVLGDDITRLPDTLFRNNQNLRELRIYHCPNLGELPEGHQSIETLVIGDCPSLQSISYPSATLRHLSISYCQSLTSLPNGMLKSCTGLSFLRILKCPKLTSLLKGIECLSSLTDLSIGDQFSDQSLLEGVIQQLKPSLRRLTLNGRRDWDTLPHQLQHLTSVTELGLHDFGIRALPEWLQNLLSLQQLKLSRCEKLEEMPALKQLKRLYIDKCPVLRERCTGPADEPPLVRKNINDIPDVQIDGHPIGFWLKKNTPSTYRSTSEIRNIQSTGSIIDFM